MVDHDTPIPHVSATKDDKPSSSQTMDPKSVAPLPRLGLHLHLEEIAYAGEPIFQDLDLHLEAGKTTCLLGPSGAGKTSILKSIAGFLPLSEGSFIRSDDGEPLSGRISYMDQSDLLLPWATALENVMIGARLAGQKTAPDKARHLLDLVGLKDKEHLSPAELSGGMKQRVALARTLMDDSPLVLVDEPFSALDAITRHRLQALFARLLADRTVLMITHDPMEALRLGHSAYVLSGNPVQISPRLRIDGDVPRDPTADRLKPRHDLIMSMLGMTQEAQA